ncbi:MAG: hypothetical protein ACYDAK_13015 [Candidatus Limnocylindrales bacterium]
MTDDLRDAAESIADAADSVADAATDVIVTPTAVIDSGPIADAIGDASDEATHLSHEGRIAALEATSGIVPEHTHDEFATLDHAHTEPSPVDDIPAPEAPPETEEDAEPTDEAPQRTHLLLARPFAHGGS